MKLLIIINGKHQFQYLLFFNNLFLIRLAISLGTTTEFLSTKKKIETGWTLREYLTKAIELNEKDAILHYILGRWFYGKWVFSDSNLI